MRTVTVAFEDDLDLDLDLDCALRVSADWISRMKPDTTKSNCSAVRIEVIVCLLTTNLQFFVF